jgi:hypothetical protein
VVMDWLNIVVSMASAAVAVGIAWGVMNTKVEYLEKIIEELKAEVKDFRKLNEDLAVVKHDINSIKDLLNRHFENSR